jgi:hypothetical protein
METNTSKHVGKGEVDVKKENVYIGNGLSPHFVTTT